MNDDRLDRCLLLIGEVRGDVKCLLAEDKDLGKRIKSLEITRTRQFAVFGLFGSVFGWFTGLFTK